MSHFLDRYTQYDLWIAHGEPKVIWLSGLHNRDDLCGNQISGAPRRLRDAVPMAVWTMATSSTKVTEYTESAMPPAMFLTG